MHCDRLQFVPSTIIFRQTIITNPGKQGKHSPCSPALQNSKKKKKKKKKFLPNVNKKPNIQANRYNQSRKTGKTFALFAHSSKFKKKKFQPNVNKKPNIQANRYNQSGKTGKMFTLFARSSKLKKKKKKKKKKISAQRKQKTKYSGKPL